MEGEEQGWGAGLLGGTGVGAELMEDTGQAEAEPRRKGASVSPPPPPFPPRPGQDRAAASCQTHNLILRLYSLCLGDFQLAVVSFTDGFAAANYKFVSNSLSDASEKKPIPLQIVHS